MKALIIPYVTMTYSSLFSKEYILPNDKLVENIDYLEFDKKRSEQFYKTNNLQVYFFYQEYLKLILIYPVQFIKLFLLSIIKNIKYRRFFFVILKNELLKIGLILFFTKTRPNIIVYGYDILIKQYISLAASECNIQTVAILERPVHCFTNIYAINVDYYFVGGEAMKNALFQNSRNKIKEVIPIGLIRTDIIYNFKKFNKVDDNHVLVFDFHSDDYPHMGLNSWKNNKIFYDSIIKLAKQYPNKTFTIRGKNINWVELRYFEDIMLEIRALNNIIINDKYELNESYRLLSLSSIVIGRHSSILDEAILAEKKVMILDYFDGDSFHIQNILDYSGMALVIKNYQELSEQFENILSGKDFRNKEKIHKYFGIYDGKCQFRYLNELEKILNKL